jgi:hypothetical protein
MTGREDTRNEYYGRKSQVERELGEIAGGEASRVGKRGIQESGGVNSTQRNKTEAEKKHAQK